MSLYFNPFRAHGGIQIRTGAERNTPKNHTENVGRERALVMLGIYFAKRYQQQPGTKQNLTLPGWSSIHGPNSFFFFAANLSVVGNLFPHSPYQHCIDRRKSQSGSPSFIGIGMVSFSAMCTFTQSSVFFFSSAENYRTKTVAMPSTGGIKELVKSGNISFYRSGSG